MPPTLTKYSPPPNHLPPSPLKAVYNIPRKADNKVTSCSLQRMNPPQSAQRKRARATYHAHSPPEKRCASTELESMPSSLPFSQLLFIVHTTVLVLLQLQLTSKLKGDKTRDERKSEGDPKQGSLWQNEPFSSIPPLSSFEKDKKKDRNTCFLLTFYLPFKKNCNLSPPSTSPSKPPSAASNNAERAWWSVSMQRALVVALECSFRVRLSKRNRAYAT